MLFKIYLHVALDFNKYKIFINHTPYYMYYLFIEVYLLRYIIIFCIQVIICHVFLGFRIIQTCMRNEVTINNNRQYIVSAHIPIILRTPLYLWTGDEKPYV